jgi:ABC-type transport system involved in multi-copper enzyme maturation permease subunit
VGVVLGVSIDQSGHTHRVFKGRTMTAHDETVAQRSSLRLRLADWQIRLFAGMRSGWHIVLRELRELGHRRRTYLLRLAVLVAALLVLIVATWDRHNADNVGRDAMYSLGLIQMIFVLLYAPAVTAQWFQQEREGKTIELLFSTPVNSALIVLGKSVSRLFELSLLVLVLLPVYVALSLLGGVAPHEAISLLLLSIGSATLAGGLGLLGSVLFPRVRQPLAWTYAGMAIVWLLPLVWHENRMGTTTLITPLLPLWIFNPFREFAEMTRGGGSIWTSVGMFSIGVGCMALAAVPLRRAALAAPVGGQRDDRSDRKRPSQRLPFPVRRRRSLNPWLILNPVLHLTCLRATAGSRKIWRHIFLAGFVLLTLVLILADDDSWSGFAFFIMVVLLFGAAWMHGSNAFVEEKRLQTRNLLLLTTMPDWSIVAGKLMGFVRLYAPHLLLFLLGGGLRLLLEPHVDWEQIPFLYLGLLSLAVSIVLFNGYCMWFSWHCRGMATALLTSVGTAVVLIFVSGLLLEPVGERLFGGTTRPPWLLPLVNGILAAGIVFLMLQFGDHWYRWRRRSSRMALLVSFLTSTVVTWVVLLGLLLDGVMVYRPDPAYIVGIITGVIAYPVLAFGDELFAGRAPTPHRNALVSAVTGATVCCITWVVMILSGCIFPGRLHRWAYEPDSDIYSNLRLPMAEALDGCEPLMLGLLALGVATAITIHATRKSSPRVQLVLVASIPPAAALCTFASTRLLFATALPIVMDSDYWRRADIAYGVLFFAPPWVVTIMTLLHLMTSLRPRTDPVPKREMPRARRRFLGGGKRAADVV